MLNGFKTFAVGFGLAVLPQAISFATDFDFVKVFGLSPNALDGDWDRDDRAPRGDLDADVQGALSRSRAPCSKEN